MSLGGIVMFVIIPAELMSTGQVEKNVLGIQYSNWYARSGGGVGGMVLDCPPVRTAVKASHRAAPERDVVADSSERRERSSMAVSQRTDASEDQTALERCSASSSLMLLRFPLFRTLSCWTRSTRGLGSTSLTGPMLLRLTRLLGF